MTTVHELRRKETGEMLAYMNARPPYCDRGRWHANIEVGGVWVSDADPWPRYYFFLEAGKLEVVAYLKEKKVDVTNTEWIERAL